LNVVAALKKNGPCGSSFGHLIEDTRLWLQRLPHVFIHHVCREANAVAHCLAQLAISQFSDDVRIGDCPSMIRNVLLA
jgi:hypothetical protein